MKEALVFPSTSEEALEVYECLRTSLLQSGLRQRRSLPAQARELGSAPLQQVPSSPLPVLAPAAASAADGSVRPAAAAGGEAEHGNANAGSGSLRGAAVDGGHRSPRRHPHGAGGKAQPERRERRPSSPDGLPAVS